MPRSTRVWILTRTVVPLAALMAGLTGCAQFAVPTDTPARNVSYIDLNDPAPPGERYYLLVFGSQTTPKVPRFTHTWITFVRVQGDGCELEQHTISWMPATLFIKTFQPFVEPGVNLTLIESIEMARSYGERVSLWGPYEIPPGLYRKLLLQKQYIESGAIGYQCIDTIGEAGLARDRKQLHPCHLRRGLDVRPPGVSAVVLRRNRQLEYPAAARPARGDPRRSNHARLVDPKARPGPVPDRTSGVHAAAVPRAVPTADVGR